VTLTGFLVMVFFAIPVLVGTYNTGRARGRAEERARKPKQPKPICPCEHVWGEHKDGGKCQGMVRRAFYYKTGTRNGYEWVPCSCMKYHGPVPITDQFFHPGFTRLPEIDS
jgi:hypothetical protein